MNNAGNKFAVVGYVPYVSNGIRFALTIFSNQSNPASRMMQFIDNISNKILTFKSIDLDEASFVDCKCPTVAAIGEEPIFTFVNNERKVSIGTLLHIKSELVGFEKNNPKEVSILLQIRELLGTQEEKRSSRKKFRNSIYDLGDTSAADFFVADSILKIELWNLLIKFSPSPEITEAILKLRSRINVHIEENNVVSVEAEILKSINYPLEIIGNITNYLQEEFNITFKPDFNVDLVEQSEIVEYDKVYKHAISAISRSRRQEERVAILLRILTEEFDLGRQIISVYTTDRGKFASGAIRKIVSIMIDDRPEHISTERLAEMIFDQLYKECFPMSRGPFLYYFAKHFSSDALISKSIIQKISQKTSRYVEAWKEQIYYVLSQTKPQIYSEKYFDQADIFQNLEMKGSENSRLIR